MNINPNALSTILKEAGIDERFRMPTGCSAFEYLEACVMGALDEIEEAVEEAE